MSEEDDLRAAFREEVRAAWEGHTLSDGMREAIIRAGVLPQINDPVMLRRTLADVLDANPGVTKQGYLVGEAMKKLDGRGNGRLLARILVDMLS